MRRLEDITTLTEDEKQMLREVKAAVLRHEPNAEVILYGSAARGEHGPESDYDVLVLVPQPLPHEAEQRLRYAVYDVAFDRELLVSVMIYTREQWASPVHSVSPYHRNVESEGARV